jgi:8-oxo-dGTP pyrophosphatase MutT (NUDIX family)
MDMEIKSTLINRFGQKLGLIYREDDLLKDLDGIILQAVHAFCFCDGKLVIVYAAEKGYWAPPGGGIEQGETYEEAVIREVKEETNMKVLSQKFIGYQDIYEPDRIVRQTRSICVVEPYGPFHLPSNYCRIYQVTIHKKWLRIIAVPLLRWYSMKYWEKAVIDQLKKILEKRS